MTRMLPLAIASGAESLISIQRIQVRFQIEVQSWLDVVFEPYGYFQKFLLYEENSILNKDNDTERFSNGLNKNFSPGIKFENVTCEWVKDREPTLNNVSISISPGKLLTVIGHVGAGKVDFNKKNSLERLLSLRSTRSVFQSSLLNAILRELTVKSGNLSVNGVFSYASQEPWLFSGSIRQNILFGTEYDRQRYKKVNMTL